MTLTQKMVNEASRGIRTHDPFRLPWTSHPDHPDFGSRVEAEEREYTLYRMLNDLFSLRVIEVKEEWLTNIELWDLIWTQKRQAELMQLSRAQDCVDSFVGVDQVQDGNMIYNWDNPIVIEVIHKLAQSEADETKATPYRVWCWIADRSRANEKPERAEWIERIEPHSDPATITFQILLGFLLSAAVVSIILKIAGVI